MMLIEFMEQIAFCFEDSNYIDVYESYKNRISEYASNLDWGDNFQKFYVRSGIIEALRYLKKDYMRQLFAILEQCEPENMGYLLHAVYDEELKRDKIDWKLLFLIMGHVDDEELLQRARQYFAQDTIGAEWLGKKMAQVMHECFYEIRDYYFRIVKGIASALQEPNTFLTHLERNLKKAENSAKVFVFDFYNQQEMESYFQFLCDQGAYNAANAYLDRVWRESNPIDLFDKEPSEIKKMLYCLPSPEILSFGKTYMQKKLPLYTHEDWLEDVRTAYNEAGMNEQRQSVMEWVEVCVGINRLYENRENEFAEDALKQLSQTKMYATETYSYMTQMCRQLAEIMQEWLLDDSLSEERLIERIECLDDKNLFSYEYYDWYTSSYISYDKFKENINWTALKKKYIYGVKKTNEAGIEQGNDANVDNLVYIFLHTPLWLNIDFYELVKRANELRGGKSLADVFAKYSFAGNVVKVDDSTTAAERLQLVPRFLFWPRNSFEDEKGKRRTKYDRVLMGETDWVTKPENKEKLQGIKYKQSVKFKISTLDETDRDTIRIVDICDDSDAFYEGIEQEETEKTEEIFLQNLDNWFRCMSQKKQFVKWANWDNPLQDSGNNDESDETVDIGAPLFVKESMAMKDRVEIAGKFLDTIADMVNDSAEAVENLLRACSFPPLEHVNEFRYIAAQHWTDFTTTPEQEVMLERKAVRLMEEMDIPQALKLEIYMNTCVRKVYPLEKLIEKNGEIAKLLFAPQTEWVVPVKFVGKDGGRVLFSMESMQRKVGERFVTDLKKQNVIKSTCSFCYNGNIAFRRAKFPEALRGPKYLMKEKPILDDGELEKLSGRFVMYATLKGMKDGVIEINRYFVNSRDVKLYFPWREYKKCFYDLKKIDVKDTRKAEKWLVKVYNDLFAIRTKFSLQEEHKNTPIKKCMQSVAEMDAVFHKVDFDIEMCRDIVRLLGNQNPFKDALYKQYIPEEAEGNSQDTLKTFVEECRSRYGESYHKFMGAIDAERPKSINFIGTVYYLSYLQLLVEEKTFVQDVMKKHSIMNETEVSVREKLDKCKAELNDSVEKYQRKMANLSAKYHEQARKQKR